MSYASDQAARAARAAAHEALVRQKRAEINKTAYLADAAARRRRGAPAVTPAEFFAALVTVNTVQPAGGPDFAAIAAADAKERARVNSTEAAIDAVRKQQETVQAREDARQANRVKGTTNTFTDAPPTPAENAAASAARAAFFKYKTDLMDAATTQEERAAATELIRARRESAEHQEAVSPRFRGFTAPDEAVIIRRATQDGLIRCAHDGQAVVAGVDKNGTPNRGFDIDHIKPFSQGGVSVVENAQVLCSFHNRSFGDKT